MNIQEWNGMKSGQLNLCNSSGEWTWLHSTPFGKEMKWNEIGERETQHRTQAKEKARLKSSISLLLNEMALPLLKIIIVGWVRAIFYKEMKYYTGNSFRPRCRCRCRCRSPFQIIIMIWFHLVFWWRWTGLGKKSRRESESKKNEYFFLSGIWFDFLFLTDRNLAIGSKIKKMKWNETLNA